MCWIVGERLMSDVSLDNSEAERYGKVSDSLWMIGVLSALSRNEVFRSHCARENDTLHGSRSVNHPPARTEKCGTTAVGNSRN